MGLSEAKRRSEAEAEVQRLKKEICSATGMPQYKEGVLKQVVKVYVELVVEAEAEVARLREAARDSLEWLENTSEPVNLADFDWPIRVLREAIAESQELSSEVGFGGMAESKEKE